MASNTRDLIVRIIGDATGMNKATKEAEGGLAGFEARLGKVGSAITAAFAGGAILNFAKVSVQAALEDQRAQERLQKTLENVTGATKDQVAAIEKSINSMQSQFAVADDELRPAMESLVRATKDTGQAQQLLKLALDISAGSGKGLQEVSVALVKAMGGQTRGLKDLGIQVKDTEGKALSFNDIVAQLSGTFAGQAARAADSQTGRLKALAIQYDELKETVGTALLPVLAQLAQIATTLFGWFNHLDSGTQQFIAQLVVFGGIAFSAVKAFTAIKAAVAGMNLAMASTPWGAIAAGVGIVAGAFLLSGKSATQATGSVQDYVNILKQAGSESKKLLEAKVLETLSDPVIADALERAGLSAADATKYILGYSDALADAMDVPIKRGRSIMPLAGFLFEQRQRLDEARDAAAKYKDAENQLADASQSTTQEVYSQNQAIADAQGSRAKYIEQLEEFSKKMWSTGDAASDMADSIKNAVDDIRAKFDTGFAADKALADFKEDIKTLDDDLKGLKEGSAEYKVVIKERADGALNVAETFAEAEIAVRNLNDRERDFAKNQAIINKLAEIRSTLAPDSPLRQYLDDFIDDLLELDGTYDARINVTVAGMPGITAGERHSNNFGLTSEQLAAILANVRKRAGGGPVSAGSPYLVGEQGPELFVPGTSGSIIPNGSTSGSVINVTINTVAGDPLAIERVVVDAIGRASRRGLTTLKP